MKIVFKKPPADSEGFTVFYAVILNLIISTLLLGIFAAVTFYQIRLQRGVNKYKLYLACYSAVQKTLNNGQLLPGNDSMIIDGVTISLHNEYRGFFFFITATAKQVHDSVLIEYQAGEFPGAHFSPAITFTDPGFRASVSGTTKIKGNIEAPDNKISLATVYGISLASRDYLEGVIIKNKDLKPRIFREVLHPMLTAYPVTGENTKIYSPGFRFTDTVFRQMIRDTDSVLVVNGDAFFSGIIDLERIKRRYRIIVHGSVFIDSLCFMNMNNTSIYCDSSVSIYGQTIIENSIFFAGKNISAYHTTARSSQFYAKGTIRCTGSNFRYPSLLLLDHSGKGMRELSAIQNPYLSCLESVINGDILLLCETTGQSVNNSRIIIDKQSKVQGIIYSENEVFLEGTLLGSLYTYNLWYYLPPTQYRNWLINTDINRKDFSPAYLTLPVFENEGRYSILSEKWIY